MEPLLKLHQVIRETRSWVSLAIVFIGEVLLIVAEAIGDED